MNNECESLIERKSITTVCIVIPCYNEAAVIEEAAKQLVMVYNKLIGQSMISPESKILFVNDGSLDQSWTLIKQQVDKNRLFAGLSLARNKGHQNALLAGLMIAKDIADAVISMDVDLQDDVSCIEQFIVKYLSGYDIVYGVRSARDTDSFFKRVTAESFYKLMKFLGVEIVFNHADYRLMSKRALAGLSEFKEVNLFLRGIIPQIGYPSTTVSYERKERFAGESKYPLKKMLSFAFNGITSFSIKPIRFVSMLGGISFLVSIIMLTYSMISYALGNTVSGWTSLGVSIWALGGLQLLAVGVVGEYIGKVYLETKRRPNYIIDQVIGLKYEKK